MPSDDLLSRGFASTLSSALNVFTSEFEMDSGGSHSLLSLDKPVTTAKAALKLTMLR